MYEDNQRMGNGHGAGAGVRASITGGGIGGNCDSYGDGDFFTIEPLADEETNYGNGWGDGVGGWTDRDEQLSLERQGTNKK